MTPCSAKRGRILSIHHGSARAGAARSLLALLRGLRELGYDVVVGNTTGDAEVQTFFGAAGFRVIVCGVGKFSHTTGGWFRLGTPGGWKSLLRWVRESGEARARLREVVREIQPDVVHLNSVTLAPYAGFLEAEGVPVVVHVREHVLGSKRSLRRRWLSKRVWEASRVIAISHENADRILDGRRSVDVVLNPVDLSEFDWRKGKLETRRRLGLDEGREYVLFAGGSVAVAKGLDDFLGAVRLLRRSRPQATAITAGFVPPPGARERTWTLKRRMGQIGGLYRSNDRRAELCRAIGNGDGLIALPFTDDIGSWMAAADVICVPHVLPHFSRTVLEAGAMKKPVVGYASSGVKETIEASGSGLLVEVHDVPGLAKAIARVLDDGVLAAGLGARGYDFVIRECNLKKNAAAVDSILQGAIREFRCREREGRSGEAVE